MPVNPDFVALLRELSAADVRFLVVGAYAVSFHSRPRATGDLDLWVDPSPGNARSLFRALGSFGAPLSAVSAEDFTRSDTVFQMGVPPRRIDILTSLTGLRFDDAWPRRIGGKMGEVPCPFIGKQDLVCNKRALGRPRDLADLEMLGEEP
jgi:hypothetical protein